MARRVLTGEIFKRKREEEDRELNGFMPLRGEMEISNWKGATMDKKHGKKY